MSFFKPASKELARAKVALTGPSGAGKTFSSLLLAKGLTNNGKVAVIDTENNSASLYVDKFGQWNYDVAAMSPPYTAKKYHDSLQAAVQEKYDCVIVDSMTHLWAGEGGLLQQKEALDSRGGNSYTNWNTIGKYLEQIKSLILHSPIHVITTLRSKQEYVLQAGANGKMAPVKMGMAPIMRDGMEYEFTVVFDIGMDHQFMVSKDRTDLFDNMVAKISEDTGRMLRDWLADEVQTPISGGQDETKTSEQETANTETKPQASQNILSSGQKAQRSPILGKSTGVRAKPNASDHSRSDAKAQSTDTSKKQGVPDTAKDRSVAATASESTPVASANPGDYVIQFGEKYGARGKNISEIPESLLRQFINWVEEERSKGRALLASQTDFERNAKLFINSITGEKFKAEVAREPDFDPQYAPSGP